jgi:hypothetical protein
MPKKLRAVEVIPNKLWITYDTEGNKTGTMRISPEDGFYFHYFSDSSKENLAYLIDEIDLIFEFEGKPELSSWHQEHVFGYPVAKIETFKTQEKDNLPCFTKTPTSKVYFAAGYYGINFDNGGWMDSFCPKLSTLRKYEHVGPFKTLTDAQLAVKRKQRRYE